MMTHNDRHYCTSKELRQVMTHLQREGTYFIAGTNSIYVPKGKVRYLDTSVCKPWPNLDGEVIIMSPGEAVRTELVREWPGLKRVGWSGKQVVLLDWRSPLHYTGQHVGPMIYVDLDAAYLQIYKRLWLDTTYPRAYYGRYPLSAVAKNLEIWKAARNCLVGISRSREAVAYKGTKRVSLKIKNRYLSPGLWATVQNMLHWIAGLAIKHGAIYVNVDGYIFPDEGVEFIEPFLTEISDLGIKWSVRAQGPGEIVSWNNYRIKNTKTQAYRLGLTHNSKGFTNVITSNEGSWRSYWKNCCRIHRNADGNGVD